MSEKVSRKELLKQEDPFVAFMARVGAWAQENTKGLVLAAVALVALGGIVSTATAMSQRSREAANAALSEGLTRLDARVGEAAEDDGLRYETEVARSEAALESFERAREVGGAAGQLGALYVADLQRKLGKDAEALAVLKALVNDLASDDSFRFVVYERLGQLQAEMGDAAAAAASYAAIKVRADAAAPLYRYLAGYRQARLLANAGDKPAALAALDGLDEGAAKSPFAGRIVQLRRELEAAK